MGVLRWGPGGHLRATLAAERGRWLCAGQNYNWTGELVSPQHIAEARKSAHLAWLRHEARYRRAVCTSAVQGHSASRAAWVGVSATCKPSGTVAQERRRPHFPHCSGAHAAAHAGNAARERRCSSVSCGRSADSATIALNQLPDRLRRRALWAQHRCRCFSMRCCLHAQSSRENG